MSTPNWKAHFTQPISGYDPVEAQGLSELGYALRHKQISEEEYLNWARENFELASLDMKFFQTIPAPRAIYEKLKDVYAWGPECLPIGEWEEHLLIAGLQKPEDFPQELNPIFLLAPVNGLLEFWSHFVSEEAMAEGEGEVVESGGMPEGFNLDVSPQTQTQATNLSFSGIKLATGDHAPAPAAAVVKEEPNEVKAIPISLNIGEDTGLKVVLSPTPPQPAAEIPQATPAQSVSSSSYTMPPLNPKVPPPSAIKPISTAVGADTMVVSNPPPETLENTVPEIKAQPKVLPVNSELVNIPESQIKELFLENKKHYEKQLYIEFSDATKTAYAKYWPNDFVANETPSPHSITEDSFLSIVAKTQKPYHGYVVKNTLAENFFKEVNSGQIPENITVVPLVKNDIVVGAVMGWGPKSTYSLTVLRDMERTVNAFCLKLGWVAQEAA